MPAPAQESRHNLTYWRYGDYAGIGPGAHGRRLGMRTVRHSKPENFLSAVARNGHGIAEEEPLSPVEAADEALVMGLRLAEGIDADAIAAPLRPRVDCRLAQVDRLVGFRSSGCANGGRIALTRQRPAAARPYPRRDRRAASLGFGGCVADAGVGGGVQPVPRPAAPAWAHRASAMNL